MARQALIVLVVVVTFGILVPWYKGFAFLDPRIIAAYGCMALLFVAPASAELAAQLRSEPSRSALLGRIGIVVAYSWAVTVIILVSGLVTLNLTNWRGVLIHPAWGLLAAVLVFSLAGSAAVATASAVLARYFSAAGVKSILRGVFLLVLMILVFSSRLLPESWQIALMDYTTRRAITRLAWEASIGAVIIAGALLIPLLSTSSKGSD